MADGASPFTRAGQYYYQQQNQHIQSLQRPTSPADSPRAGYRVTDISSPNKSQELHIPASSMFSQGQHQGQHSMLNGGQMHQRYQMQMNLSKHFPGQSSQHQQNHSADHSLQNGYGSHQHTVSTGTLSSATPHFTPSHAQSSTPVGGVRPDTEHWHQQMRVAQATREVNHPHYFARILSGGNKAVITNNLHAGLNRDDETETSKPANAVAKAKQPWRTLDFSGQGLKVVAPSLFRYPFLEKLHFNNNKLSWITPQIGSLKGLTFLDLSQNQLESLPGEVGMLVNLKTLYLFDNHLETLPFEMGYLYNLDFLGIEGNPLNDDLREIVAESGSQGLIKYMREQASVPDPPNPREWVVLDETPTGAADEDRFTVFDANILCPKYVTATQYPYVPSAALAWEHRRDLVVNDIRQRDADIVCLQEIDSDTFHEDFRGTLAVNGYKGIFWQKSRAQTMGEREAKLVDGCATFWKDSKYILLDKQMVDYRKMAINRADMKGEHDIFNRVMTRDDIATITFLENRSSGSRLIVVNTHCFWNPEFADVKVVQIAILMEYLTRLTETYVKWPPCKMSDKVGFRYANGDSDPVQAEKEFAPSMHYANRTDIPMLICGDLNSTPGSGPYDLISHGSLAAGHEDLAGRSYGLFTREGIQHPFSLKSTYGAIGEMECTNYTASWQGVVDYIWYSTASLQPTGLLGEIDRAYVQRVPGFPSWHFPSDHLPLFAQYVVKGKKEKKVVEADFGPSRERRM